MHIDRVAERGRAANEVEGYSSIFFQNFVNLVGGRAMSSQINPLVRIQVTRGNTPEDEISINFETVAIRRTVSNSFLASLVPYGSK